MSVINFKIIVGMCRNGGIGFKDRLPWNIKEDLRHFSKMTKGNDKEKNAILMGKNTWISIGEKPLPKRDNIILSSSIDIDSIKYSTRDNAIMVFRNIQTMKEWLMERNYHEVWVIGGESIYKEFIDDPDTTEMWITEIDSDFECDTYFPLHNPRIEAPEKGWILSKEKTLVTTQPFNVNITCYSKTNIS